MSRDTVGISRDEKRDPYIVNLRLLRGLTGLSRDGRDQNRTTRTYTRLWAHTPAPVGTRVSRAQTSLPSLPSLPEALARWL